MQLMLRLPDIGSMNFNSMSTLKGLVEGLLDGNVEILHLEDELSAVIYHISQPEILPCL